MSIKIKFIIQFLYIKSIIFISAFFLPLNAETKIIAKNGDTLFKLSKEYGITLKELMHKNNITDAKKLLNGEVIIIPSKDSNIIYKVKEGDTIYKIARDHNISVSDIISTNYLKHESYLRPNQILKLPIGPDFKTFKQEKIKLANKKVFYHETSRFEELRKISLIHDVEIDEIISLNKLTSRAKISPDTKLKIRDSLSLKWLKYGSLTINWSGWTYIDGDYITEAKNKKNKSFYVALRCEDRILNNTIINSYWTSWYFPRRDFEFKLINDFCDSDNEI